MSFDLVTWDEQFRLFDRASSYQELTKRCSSRPAMRRAA